MTEIARRVRELGYAETMSRQRVAQLADTDPAWPIPRDQWKRLGRYWLLPWAPIADYFKHRTHRRGGPRGWAHHDHAHDHGRHPGEAIGDTPGGSTGRTGRTGRAPDQQ